jgi:hypothetical protein
MSNIYKPPGCFTLDTLKDKPQIRLGLQGYGGSGKTWASLTFPNPIVLNLDRGLGAHTGRSDVIEIPFYRSEFCGTANQLKDKILIWLDKEGRKLTPEQTLVFDGCTSLQNAYHKWFADNQMSFLTKGGKVDDFAEWSVKRKYFAEMMEMFKSLSCNVVFIVHEADKKDKDGSYTGKIRPLLSGSFGDELLNHFSDWFRQLVSDKPDLTQEIKQTTLDAFGMDKKQFIELCNSFPRNAMYYWQTEGDSIFDGKCSSLVNFPRFLRADYSSFLNYGRKQ